MLVLFSSCITSNDDLDKSKLIFKLGQINFSGDFVEVTDLLTLKDTTGVKFDKLKYSSGDYTLRVEMSNNNVASRSDSIAIFVYFSDSTGNKFVDSNHLHGYKYNLPKIDSTPKSVIFQTRYILCGIISGKPIFLISNKDWYYDANDYYLLPADKSMKLNVDLIQEVQ
jgi:hypothetical protein